MFVATYIPELYLYYFFEDEEEDESELSIDNQKNNRKMAAK